MSFLDISIMPYFFKIHCYLKKKKKNPLINLILDFFTHTHSATGYTDANDL